MQPSIGLSMLFLLTSTGSLTPITVCYSSVCSQRFFTSEVIHCDAFIARLIHLAGKVYKGERPKLVTEDVRLHLLRNDFMPTDADSRLLQVEINTISAGFAGILESLSMVHRSTRAIYYPHLQGEQPEHSACLKFSDAIADALSASNTKWGRNSQVVLFVVEENEKNVVDQYALEYRLLQRHGISVLRRTLGQIHHRSELTAEQHLMVDNIEIGLVYFRSAYDPKQYPTDAEWAARELIERSCAVKCPTLLTQLAGTKKVQQLWYVNGGEVLKRFGLSETEIKSLFDVFAVQADPSSDEQCFTKAVADPEGWVLKPQREGGGHNIYGEELRTTLTTATKDELSQYVLMERMRPVPAPALVLDCRATTVAGLAVPALVEEAISELGIYSYYIPHLNKNEVCGHLLRTKEKNVREGGVNAGFAVLDTVILIYLQSRNPFTIRK